MSIATELQRIETAKANLKTQIEAKGVSIPASATIDSYATYVQEIPQGGGSGETKDYLKFINPTDSPLTQLSFTRAGNPINDLKIKASTDGENWTSYTISGTSVSIPIPPNGFLLIDGSENEIWGYDKDNSWKIGGNSTYAVSGKLSSLISKNASYVCFSNLFYNSYGLVDASNFILDYENVPSYGYYSMFYNCTGMTSAPVILATTVGEYAFDGMFYGCSKLTTAPELNVSFTQKNSFSVMFFNCNGLTTGPSVISFERMGEQVCYQMFGNCNSLTTAPKLPNTTLSKACYQGMFQGCTSLTTAPELPATTLSNDCYYSMFKGCTSLTTAPILHADNINKGSSYREMFYGCTNLDSITCLATIFNTGNTRQWVTNVASQGTFYCASGKTNTWTKGENGCPATWTIQEYTPTPTNKVLTITDFDEPTNDSEQKSVTVQIGGTPIAQYAMDGIDDGEGNVIVNVAFDYAATGYTTSYSNRTYTIEGPFDNNPTVYYSGYDPIQPCYPIDNSETITFTGSSATTTANFSGGEEPDPECDCQMQGGAWDGEECQFGGGGCDGDPYCECLENGGTTEECDCMMMGGTWEDGECQYPE